MPSITVPANATISVDAGEAEWVAPVINNAYNTIVSLVADQEIWLNGVHRTANEQLYVILQRCYHLYSLMASDKAQNENLKAAIERHNNERNLGIDAKSHTMTNIIKVVFGADRRRASSYSSALRVALAEKVEVQDLPQFLRDAGGVEEVRRQQTNGGAPKVDKVEAAVRQIANVNLAVIDADAISSKLDCGAIGKHVILVATQDINGTLIINSVVQTEGVTNAVLTAIYNAEHKEWSKQKAEEQPASEADELDALINAAVNDTDFAAAA
jgi:ferritin-like metal-binding protein YciE